jgi:hypothetical protein
MKSVGTEIQHRKEHSLKLYTQNWNSVFLILSPLWIYKFCWNWFLELFTYLESLRPRTVHCLRPHIVSITVWWNVFWYSSPFCQWPELPVALKGDEMLSIILWPQKEVPWIALQTSLSLSAILCGDAELVVSWGSSVWSQCNTMVPLIVLQPSSGCGP